MSHRYERDLPNTLNTHPGRNGHFSEIEMGQEWEDLLSTNPAAAELFSNPNYWLEYQGKFMVSLSHITLMITHTDPEWQFNNANLREFMYATVLRKYKKNRGLEHQKGIGINLPKQGTNKFLSKLQAADLLVYLSSYPSQKYRLLNDQTEYLDRIDNISYKKAPEITMTVGTADFNNPDFHFNRPVPNPALRDRKVRIDYLSADEELYCWLKQHHKDQDAEEYLLYLLRSNERFIYKMARNLQGRGLTLDGLFQTGVIGAMEGIFRYNPEIINPKTGKPHRLNTYIAFWVYQAMGRAIAYTGRSIQLNPSAFARIGKVYQAIAELDQGENPVSIQDLASHLDLPEERVEKLLEQSKAVWSLDRPLDTNPGTDTRLDFIEDKNAPIENTVAINYRDKIIEETIDKLHPAYQFILVHRFGLKGEEAKTLREVGELVGLSRESIRLKQNEALEKLARLLPRETNLLLNLD